MSKIRRLLLVLVVSVGLAIVVAPPASADSICVEAGVGPLGGEICIPAP